MSEFKVGDKVRVKRTGECYSTYKNFFRENNLTHFASRYNEDASIQPGDYKVVGIGKHHSISLYGPIYVLEGEAGNIYLTGNDKGDSIELVKEEPKTMKAYELMKLAAENPEKHEGKRYKVNGEVLTRTGESAAKEEIVVRDGRVQLSHRRTAFITCDTELEEIKPEPKPVTFMEAVKAFADGKTIKCINGDAETVYRGDGAKKLYDNSCSYDKKRAIASWEILNGTWYIIEE